MLCDRHSAFGNGRIFCCCWYWCCVTIVMNRARSCVCVCLGCESERENSEKDGRQTAALTSFPPSSSCPRIAQAFRYIHSSSRVSIHDKFSLFAFPLAGANSLNCSFPIGHRLPFSLIFILMIYNIILNFVRIPREAQT